MRLFALYLILTTVFLWGALTGGGNPNHLGSWIAAITGLIVSQPWLLVVGAVLQTTSGGKDMTMESFYISIAMNFISLYVYWNYVYQRNQAKLKELRKRNRPPEQAKESENG